MRIFYRWQENFTPAGHAAAALLLFSMFAGAVPGFWAAWIFCGLDFLFILSLVPSLFLTWRKNKVRVNSLVVRNGREGENAQVEVNFVAETALDQVSLGCFRMDPSLKCVESDSLMGVREGSSVQLCCSVQTKFRGAYQISRVALLIPEIKGMLRAPLKAGSCEILVYPRLVKVGEFPFLTAGAAGLVFAPLLMPSLMRGLDFVGVREYREGDSLRDLHHKAFARYGRPFTKEFETERGAGAVFVLDVASRNLKERSLLEPLIRLAAGVLSWLQERGALGRFFIGDEEIPLVAGDGGTSFLDALARIPRAGIVSTSKDSKPHLWSPAARPMGPVLRLGLYPSENPLIHKHILVVPSENTAEESPDSCLLVPVNRLEAGEVSL